MRTTQITNLVVIVLFMSLLLIKMISRNMIIHLIIHSKKLADLILNRR